MSIRLQTQAQELMPEVSGWTQLLREEDATLLTSPRKDTVFFENGVPFVAYFGILAFLHLSIM